MKQLYKNILLTIEQEEKNVSKSSKSVIDEAYHMLSFLRGSLTDLKLEIAANSFDSILDEITFFKHVKPEILGKLIYYNKLIRIESVSPKNLELLELYYAEQIKILNKEYRKYIASSDFYKYYRSGRIDRDECYFRLGNINFFDGLNSFFFEVDSEFSTFYDYKIARILAFDLIHHYVSDKVNAKGESAKISFESADGSEFSWTDSKNALIELIYALHISGSVSNGRAGLRRMSKLFEDLFEVKLGDIHHAFHQMKFRAGEKASYLRFLKNSLEQYMNKDL
ncbi:RteC domain-containing protein [Sphingobacterium sp. SRCM116780]|uniref:RteC domain-containing protein n=1 Tax=Sphingobacterium sp. SRCM116780 TaxID=2907623 RepID=UPI001F2235EC|nr:RteC domain-containing protein [Sphingobacterium sp. SRCM116780]UIR57859.1 RteC domain-containing protein [Sphingobacterium sp. SRCM116780]